MRIGNVVKLKNNNLVIITNVTDEHVRYVYFSSSNCSGGSDMKTKSREEMCWDCDINDGGDADIECETCHGTGYYTAEIAGMDQAVVLADNVKDYIIGRLTQNFDF